MKKQGSSTEGTVTHFLEFENQELKNASIKAMKKQFEHIPNATNSL